MEISDTFMRRLLIVSMLIARYSCSPRSPRIYNVIINSKKNLVPSQAVSVYEPVLRTTSVGIALPAISYVSNVQGPFLHKYVQFYNEEGSLTNIVPREEGTSLYAAPNVAPMVPLSPVQPVSSEVEKERKETVAQPYQLNFKRLYQDLPQFSSNYNEHSEAPNVSPPLLLTQYNRQN